MNKEKLYLNLLIMVIAINLAFVFGFIYLSVCFKGFYFGPTGTIVVFAGDKDVGQVLYLVKHEVGHFVWEQKLSEEQRLEYSKIFLDSNDFQSGYAMTKVSEDFAEEYASRVVCVYEDSLLRPGRNVFFHSVFEVG